MSSIIEEHNSLVQILIVDSKEESYSNIRSLLKRLRSLKFELDWANTLEEGLVRLKSGKYQVCLLDHAIDKQRGLRFLNSLEAHSVNCPIILLSEGLSIDGDMAALRAGASDYLNKDRLQPGILHRAIRFALNRRNDSDVTTRLRQRIAKLIRSQAMGDLAGGLAQDLLQVLKRIESNLDLALGLHKSGADCSSFIKEAKEVTKQAQALANHINVCTENSPADTASNKHIAGTVKNADRNKEKLVINPGDTVLVINSNPSLLELAKLYLESGDFTGKTFSNAEFAMEWYDAHFNEVSVVILSIDLLKNPLSYIEKLFQINADTTILITTDQYSNLVKECLAKGAKQYFEIPTNFPSILAWLNEHSS